LSAAQQAVEESINPAVSQFRSLIGHS